MARVQKARQRTLLDLDGGFSGPYIFEPIVSAHGNGVLSGVKAANGEGKGFRSEVANAVGWTDQNPVAPVDAVLCFVDAAGRMAGGKRKVVGNALGTVCVHSRGAGVDFAD